MKIYSVKQTKPSKNSSNNYQLLVNRVCWLDNVSYTECLNYVYKNIKKGDVYREQEIEEEIPREFSYEDVMETQKRVEKFDSDN